MRMNTREAIHDALCWGWKKKQDGFDEYLRYGTRIEKSIREGNSSVVMLESAHILAMIDKQPGHIAAWLKFCYGPDQNRTLALCCVERLRQSRFPVISSRIKDHPRYSDRILVICEISLWDYSKRVNGRPPLESDVYIAALGMTGKSHHFARDWGPKIRECLDEIGGWDASGVGEVSRMVKALCGLTDDPDQTPSRLIGIG